MARIYADEAAYVAYHPDGTAVPTNLDTLLRVASRTVDQLLRTRVYDVDSAGMPTDPDHAQALADATCAIAGAMDAAGTLNPGASTGEWTAVKIGSLSLTGAQTTGGTATEVDGIPVPPQALTHLGDVGRHSVVVT